MTPLAAGGMARIYIARTTGIGSFERHVVLKLITPERANDHTAVQMFLDEARLAASLNHQNVAQVFEVGEDLGIHYLAMEYVHGQDLRALLAKAGSQGTRVPLELALTVVAGAASGLNHAHDRRGPDGVPLGIVHRDVSPSNIMIGYDGSVKLLDFGIAKATARSVETQSGIIKGKFAYMAPEQCRGRDVDRRSDVFSLGIILYEVSTQHRCFRADSDFDTMHRIVTGDVVRPTRLVQGYPQALEAIVMKALAVDVTQRYQSAGDLLEALESFAVASRMSLSTMSLGRFMREMFGEHPEPWLAQGHISHALLQPKESTISNTNGTGSALPVRPPTPLPVAPVVAPPVLPPPDADDSVPSAVNPASEISGPQGQTVLDLMGEDLESSDWGAKPAAEVAPPEQPPARPTPPPMPLPAPAAAAAPEPPPPPQFSSVPGSGSGPAHAAMPLAPARAGFGAATATATATHNELGYPRYEPPSEPSSELDLQPNRKPLLYGIAITLGLVVIAALAFGRGGDDDRTAATPVEPVTAPAPGSALGTAPELGSAQVAVGSSAPSVDLAVDAPPAVVEDESINVKVETDPPGANVTLAGKIIGTTPLDTQVPRQETTAYLVVSRAEYTTEEQEIDLRTDYTQKLVLKKPEPPPPQDPPKLETPKPKPPKVTPKITPKITKVTPKPTPKATPPKPTVTPTPAKPKCVKAGTQNPFEPVMCDGKPCPICK